MQAEGRGKITFVLMREHPLFGYALSFLIGAYAALELDVPIFICLAFILLSALGIVLLTLKQKRSWGFAIVLFLAGGYILSSNAIPDWYNTCYVPPEECYITGTVESVEYTDYSVEYILTDVKVGSDEIASKVKITNITDNNYVNTGDKIRLKAILEKPAAPQQDGMFSEARYYMTKDIQYVATIFDSKVLILEEGESTEKKSGSWQDKIFSKLEEDFSQPVLGMIYSVATGDKSYMDADLYKKFSELGIAHVFAISGLHIGAILILWEFYCRKTKRRFLVRVLGSSILIFLLYMIVGSRASLLRAMLMWGLIVIYEYAGVKGDLIDYLSIAMIALLIMNPLYVIDLGFVLSVSCVGAIAFIYVPILKAKKSDRLNRIINFYPVSLFLVSLAILSVSWIVTAKFFGQVAVLSPFWNVVFVPIVVVLLSLLLGYSFTFYIPIFSTAIIWIIDNLSKLTIYLANVLSSINFVAKMPNITFATAVSIITLIVLSTDVVIKGRKMLRTALCIAGIAVVGIITILGHRQDKIEVYAGYDAAFVYIAEDDQSMIIINEDDGGIERVLNDLGEDTVDVLLYTGNDIEDLEELLKDTEDIVFDAIIVNEGLLNGYNGDGVYSAIGCGEKFSFGDVTIYLEEFKANKNAVTHYYAHIDYYDREFIYLDPLRLRDGAIENCEIVISSSWTKQRVENVVYAGSKYVIMNSNDYLMDEYIVLENEEVISTFNINNEGAFTYFKNRR